MGGRRRADHGARRHARRAHVVDAVRRARRDDNAAVHDRAGTERRDGWGSRRCRSRERRVVLPVRDLAGMSRPLGPRHRRRHRPLRRQSLHRAAVAAHRSAGPRARHGNRRRHTGRDGTGAARLVLSRRGGRARAHRGHAPAGGRRTALPHRDVALLLRRRAAAVRSRDVPGSVRTRRRDRVRHLSVAGALPAGLPPRRVRRAEGARRDGARASRHSSGSRCGR